MSAIMRCLILLTLVFLLSGFNIHQGEIDCVKPVFAVLKELNPNWQPNTVKNKGSFMFYDERGFRALFFGPHLKNLSLLHNYNFWSFWLGDYEGENLNFLRPSSKLSRVVIMGAPNLTDISALTDKKNKKLNFERYPFHKRL